VTHHGCPQLAAGDRPREQHPDSAHPPGYPVSPGLEEARFMDPRGIRLACRSPWSQEREPQYSCLLDLGFWLAVHSRPGRPPTVTSSAKSRKVRKAASTHLSNPPRW
jgi:hypothetical protein